MKEQLSLRTLLRDDEDLSHRLKEVASKVKQDSAKVRNMAAEYNERYKREIDDGTRRKHLMIEDGKRRGKSAREIEQEDSGRFIPSVYTPILNWLYFFLQEGQNLEQEMLREEEEVRYGTLRHEEKIDSLESAPDMETYIYGNLTLEKFQTLKKLKRLSRSPNKNEAFQAWRRCMELCEKHGIDFDKIPNK